MMKLNTYIKGIAIVAGAYIMTSCAAGVDNTGVEYAPQMYHSVPYEGLVQVTDTEAGRWLTSHEGGEAEFYTSNPNNPHTMNMREPVANTVRRGSSLPYRIPKDSIELAGEVMKNPLPETDEILAEGKVLFTRFCWHCHGDAGLGDGPVGQKFKGVTPYTSRAVKDKPEGHIFHVITHGKGRMGSHASQLSIEERWKIVRYVQTLQNQ
ncbi:Cytochrome C oxidase, cbb3-type, subunit III [Reichenbachiella agariperforans]|uniref:Cytochrome C oxidase, cbb3-type, subunit III n=1 Tax=Reichenbachiella agariperforans TaxID=156994 RepID=A0A1M6RGB7_REIAG|nr:cytochrome c [Reichenbachiella agariperforans]SHK31428.1 Cytochrome C oxidase, cbb3-type, subunit III [Reichenbachiella agariperforans]